MGPVITSLGAGLDGATIPFVGLVEATVVQAFRRTGLPLQRVRKALEVLRETGELDHALASRTLYTDGARVLFDFAREADDPQLRLLTDVSSRQISYHYLIDEYLTRIGFDQGGWASELISPATESEILRIRPSVANGDPVFMSSGAPLYAVASR